MLTELEKKIADFVRSNGLCDSADKILLAVSGGADSTALLYVMCSLKSDGVFIGDLICAHINHQLRGAEADSDEQFVVEQAKKLNVPVITRRIDVRGFAERERLSIETAARKLRIESLLDIAKSNNCNCIVTGHQKDDNAETVVQRLMRGTGFRGLGGIWPMRKLGGDISFVRPMLCMTRDEIFEYLNEKKLRWCTDRTNKDCGYRRNFIRNRLLPALQDECNVDIAEELFCLSSSAQGFYSLVCNSVDKVWGKLAQNTNESVVLDLSLFSEQQRDVKVELVRRSIGLLKCGEGDLTHKHYEMILGLAGQDISGREIELPGGFIARREYNNLIFSRARKAERFEKQVSKGIELKVPGHTIFSEYVVEAEILEIDKAAFEKFKLEKTPYIEWFDFDKTTLPLEIRGRRTGDRFRPLGFATEKKVGKFLTAAKVPQQLRKKTLIVTDSKRIIWLWPIRISEQTKITSETRKALQLQITKSGEKR